MSILDYSTVDLQFAFWFRRKCEMLSETGGRAVPLWLDNELGRLRPLTNPNLSFSIFDAPYLYPHLTIDPYSD